MASEVSAAFGESCSSCSSVSATFGTTTWSWLVVHAASSSMSPAITRGVSSRLHPRDPPRRIRRGESRDYLDKEFKLPSIVLVLIDGYPSLYIWERFNEFISRDERKVKFILNLKWSVADTPELQRSELRPVYKYCCTHVPIGAVEKFARTTALECVADAQKRNFLDFAGFCVALRLVAMGQNGYAPSLVLLNQMASLLH